MKYKNADINGRTLHRGDIVRVVAYTKDPKMKNNDKERHVTSVYRDVVTTRELDGGWESSYFPKDLIYIRSEK